MSGNRKASVRGFGSAKFQKPGQRWQSCHEHTIAECPDEPEEPQYLCDSVDVVFVIERGYGDPGNWASLIGANGVLYNFAEYLESVATSYQLGVVSVGSGNDVTVELSMSSQNIGPFQAAVASIATDGYDQVKNMGDGLEAAVDGSAGTWRSGPDVQRYIFVIGGARPGGTDDVYSQADEDAFIQSAADGYAATDSIQTNTIRMALTLIGETPAQITEASRIYYEVAQAGHGTFDSMGEQLSLYPILLKSLDSLCHTDGGAEGTEGEYGPSSSHLICCRSGVCKLCLEFDCYGEALLEGHADWDGEAYVGFIGVKSFRAYWAIRTDCQFFVEIDGVIEAVFAKCPAYGEEGTGCRTVSGEFEYNWIDAGDAYESDGCIGTFTFRPYKPKKLARTRGVKPGACKVDLLLIMDTEWRAEYAIQDIQGGEIEPLVDAINASADSAQFGLITYNRDATATALTFSENNGVAFLAAVEALSETADDNESSTDGSRRSDLAFAAAETFGWRSDAQKAIIFLSAGVAALHNEGATLYGVGELKQTELLASVDLLRGIGVRTHGITIAFQSNITDYFAIGDAVASMFEVTQHGSGTHTIARSDGDVDDNDGNNEIAPAVNALAPRVECPEGACGEKFCGNMDCAPEALCAIVEIVDSEASQEEGCVGQGVLDWMTIQTCEAGVDDPYWNGTVLCQNIDEIEMFIEIWLEKDQYTGACVMRGEVTSYEINATLDPVVIDEDLNTLAPSWEIVLPDYRTFRVDITTLVCGTCQGCDKYCCPERPPVLYMHLFVNEIQENSGGSIEPDCLECACAPTLNIPMRIHNECALFSDEETGWRVGVFHDEGDLANYLPCASGGADFSGGIQLQCSGDGEPKTWSLYSAGEPFGANGPDDDTTNCAGLISLYYERFLEYSSIPCNSNTTYFDVMITEQPLGAVPEGESEPCDE